MVGEITAKFKKSVIVSVCRGEVKVKHSLCRGRIKGCPCRVLQSVGNISRRSSSSSIPGQLARRISGRQRRMEGERDGGKGRGEGEADDVKQVKSFKRCEGRRVIRFVFLSGQDVVVLVHPPHPLINTDPTITQGSSPIFGPVFPKYRTKTWRGLR